MLNNLLTKIVKQSCRAPVRETNIKRVIKSDLKIANNNINILLCWLYKVNCIDP